MTTTNVLRKKPLNLGKVPTLVRRVREEACAECVLQARLDEAWQQTCDAFKLGSIGLKLVNKWKAEYDRLEGEMVTRKYKN